MVAHCDFFRAQSITGRWRSAPSDMVVQLLWRQIIVDAQTVLEGYLDVMKLDEEQRLEGCPLRPSAVGMDE